jgi:uncharacterized protein YndB with AHSA1/START domain
MPRLVHQVVTLPAAPRRLYSMYLDPKAHAAFTGGGDVRISPTVGTDWSAFGGRIHGRLLALVQNRLIVQSWRSFEWREEDLDSILVLSFWPEAAGGRIELSQANVPEHVHPHLVTGWATRYWEPWRAYLERAEGNEA